MIVSQTVIIIIRNNNNLTVRNHRADVDRKALPLQCVQILAEGFLLGVKKKHFNARHFPHDSRRAVLVSRSPIPI